MVANPGAWSDPTHAELLLKLWEEGKSATEISRALDKLGVTYSRSACLGKIHRVLAPRVRANGEPMRRAPSKPGAPKVRKASLRKVSVRAEARVFGETKVPTIKGTKAPYLPLPPEPVGEHACILLDLTRQMCRWPLNALAHGDMAQTLFCGEATAEENPYCAHHSRKAVRPPEQQPKGGATGLARSLRWATA
jgi:hypothetical protein